MFVSKPAGSYRLPVDQSFYSENKKNSQSKVISELNFLASFSE